MYLAMKVFGRRAQKTDGWKWKPAFVRVYLVEATDARDVITRRVRQK
jgi:molybdopterin-guanine dinucleotide biosynthesis protein A